LEINLHKYQTRAFLSKKRIVVCSAGIQSGKTTQGAIMMRAVAARYTAQTDNFIIVAPTYKILSQATLPTFFHYAKGLGVYKKVDSEFKIFGGGTIFIRTATDPNSIEGIPNVRYIWADEAGMMSRHFFEQVMGRAAVREANIICTTTPYALNWLSVLVDDVAKGKRNDTEIIQWKSTDNPYFPKSEYDRQKKLLDPRRFAMKYEGRFGKMEGLVYDTLNKCMSHVLPRGSVYYAGVDWGYTDPFAIVIRAITPSGIHYRVDEFYKTGLTIAECINILKARHQIYNFKMCICDPSQPAHIMEINKHGIPAVGGINDIRIGIDKHIELIKTDRFWVFEDTNLNGLDEYSTYHYPEPKEITIDMDQKEQLPVDANNHTLDADRYVTMYLETSGGKKIAPKVPGTPRQFNSNQERLDWLKKPQKY
jgi:PBSX family phage terminase large subunit